MTSSPRSSRTLAVAGGAVLLVALGLVAPMLAGRSSWDSAEPPAAPAET